MAAWSSVCLASLNSLGALDFHISNIDIKSNSRKVWELGHWLKDALKIMAEAMLEDFDF